MVAVLKRDQIESKYKWNQESVFESIDDWNTEFNAVSARMSELSAFAGRLGESVETLLAWFEISEQVRRQISRLWVYPGMNSSADANDTQAQVMAGRIGTLASKVQTTIAFAQPELLAIGQERIEAWLSENAELAVYRQYFDNLFRRQAHIRSAEVEEVLGMVSDPFNGTGKTMGMLTSADFEFSPAVGEDDTELTVAQSSIDALMVSPDRETRRTAWYSYTDTYLAHKNTLASNYITSVKQNTFYARVRHYESALHASLAPNNLPVEVFHNLIETFKRNLPTWHRYWDVRRRMMGVDKLHWYDTWAPLTTNAPVVSYEQSVDWIAAGLQPLGDDYVEAMRRGCLEERWVDVYPNEGKRGGAFSSGTYDTFPFIMMSYTDDLFSMSTLAHELGHSMHSYLTRHNQPYVYGDYSLFVAEVASNFNQAMTRAYLFEVEADRDFQITLIEEAMRNFHRYFFLMPTLARFELEVHDRVANGGSPTADELNELMTGLFREGLGDTMEIDHDRIGITWATFGHLYVAFYTFQYATGISGAHSFAKRILAGDEGAAERYLGFLQAGSSGYALDVLNTAGVDLSKPDAVEETFGELSDLIDRLESLVD